MIFRDVLLLMAASMAGARPSCRGSRALIPPLVGCQTGRKKINLLACVCCSEVRTHGTDGVIQRNALANIENDALKYFANLQLHTQKKGFGHVRSMVTNMYLKTGGISLKHTATHLRQDYDEHRQLPEDQRNMLKAWGKIALPEDHVEVLLARSPLLQYWHRSPEGGNHAQGAKLQVYLHLYLYLYLDR